VPLEKGGPNETVVLKVGLRNQVSNSSHRGGPRNGDPRRREEMFLKRQRQKRRERGVNSPIFSCKKTLPHRKRRQEKERGGRGGQVKGG